MPEALPAVIERAAPPKAVSTLLEQGYSPLLARIYAARGVNHGSQLTAGFGGLIEPDRMLNLREMAQRLADAIEQRRKLLIIADYDADGATACAVGIRLLRAFGAEVDYLVPNRFEYGYGLTPEIVRMAHASRSPDMLITVDNGIASIEGVTEANRLGMAVLITDHHLPGEGLPAAECIVNPNQPGCPFPSKHLAGVGVMFYLMLRLRAELRERGRFRDGTEPALAGVLDLVALGTVADVVTLDENNRILVKQGLGRIRAGRMQPGIQALFDAAGRDPRRASTSDLGFTLGPRLNAAGRLSDMSLGIECLITDDALHARTIAGELDALNRKQRKIEAGMQEAALAAASAAPRAEDCTLTLFDPDWHQGVVGIVASRIKERFHRPTIAFARAGEGQIRGSGRSISGLHLRDALDLVSKRHPGLILRFGGHAAAAGLTLEETHLDSFRDAFENVARGLLAPSDLQQQFETDGSLAPADTTLEAALSLTDGIWGQGFPEPRFFDRFEVLDQRIVGGRHSKLRLRRAGRVLDAILFGTVETLPATIDALYRLEVNEFRGTRNVQLTLQHWRPAAATPAAL